MYRVSGSLFLGFAVFFSPIAAHANILVQTSIDLTQLQILASCGTVQLQSGFSASANALAQDDQSTPGYDFNQVADFSTSASAASAEATADGSASSATANLTASADSGVNIGNVSSYASSDGGGGLGFDYGGSGYFEVLMGSPDTSTTVNVTFTATLSGDQSITTDNEAVFATSEITLNFSLPGVGSALYMDNFLEEGPGFTLDAPYSGGPVTNTLQLETNTPYLFDLDLDSESAGYNSAAPEPSAFFLIASSLLACLLAAGLRSNPVNPFRRGIG